MGFDTGGSGIEAYGRPTDQQIEEASRRGIEHMIEHGLEHARSLWLARSPSARTRG